MNNLGEPIPVLDGVGFVQYVSHMGDDLTVVNAARVSFDNESKEFGNRDEKLIQYLAKHNHWTPFAHPQITLRIKAPISIRTQLFKHKQGFVENEISRRYVDKPPEIYIPSWRTRPTNGMKQGSGDFIDGETALLATNFYKSSIDAAMKNYEFLLSKGIAPEQARFVLPQGTYTEWWWTGSLAAYARVHGLRSDEHAQWEVRQYADAISIVLQPLFPISWKALASK